MSGAIPRLTELLEEVVHEIDRHEVTQTDLLSALMCQFAAFQNILAARILRGLQIDDATRVPGSDRLLTVAETAERLACSKDWLYRHHHRLPFAVRNGRQIRFSAEGLDRYIRDRAGAERTSHRR